MEQIGLHVRHHSLGVFPTCLASSTPQEATVYISCLSLFLSIDGNLVGPGTSSLAILREAIDTRTANVQSTVEELTRRLWARQQRDITDCPPLPSTKRVGLHGAGLWCLRSSYDKRNPLQHTTNSLILTTYVMRSNRHPRFSRTQSRPAARLQPPSL